MNDMSGINTNIIQSPIQRFSSRRQRLDRSFLCAKLRNARSYDRIAGYFCSSLLEVAGEELESVQGKIRMVCNSDLSLADIQTARAAQMAIRRSWCAFQPEKLVTGTNETIAKARFQRLYDLLRSQKLEVRVLPDSAFGLIHGKAGIITLADGSQTSFLGSANESRAGWQMNYELIWEDHSPEAIAWVQEEFDALWSSPYAIRLPDFVIEDVQRIAKRKIIRQIDEWSIQKINGISPDPAPVVVESPVYRREVGLWEHQKYFVKLVFDHHLGAAQKARFVLADQVGLGKTLQLALSALLIALTGDRPILIICPKTLIWQWQGEMRDLLDMPSAVWNGRQWVDENGIEYPAFGTEAILKCPRRVGIVSAGLITRGSEIVKQLLNLQYDCVILDEAHRARRRNIGENRDREAADPNNLLRFMYQIAEKSRSVLLATATPVQMRPIEAFDLLDVLSRGDESVLGNGFSRWRKASDGLSLIMGLTDLPSNLEEMWEWLRNPFPPKGEHRDFEILRSKLNIRDQESVIAGDCLTQLTPPDRSRLKRMFPRLVSDHNPYIRRIVRRTRAQLENQFDPETNEPLLKPIRVELFGENEQDAILLPVYLQDAYHIAEQFCRILSERMKAAGFLKTLLLRRVGSTIYAGLNTAKKLLTTWENIEVVEAEELETEEAISEENDLPVLSKTLTERERDLLEQFIFALEANKERDPKYDVVLRLLREQKWLDRGCIIFSQYRDSIQWIAEQLTLDLPDEPIAFYSGPSNSGIMRSKNWIPKSRDELKQMVMKGEIRLMLGTDAASEGINLQRLATLINLDLPWNPTRLEQRKGRIQRIGQVHETIFIYNMRYKDSVEDRVHQFLSSRLQSIYTLFGQIPDVLEDVWVAMALGEMDQAKKLIDALPKFHPFEIRYSTVKKIDWESCYKVLDNREKQRILTKGW